MLKTKDMALCRTAHVMKEVDKQRICSLSEGDKLNNSGCSIWYDTA